jgi:N-acetylmuramoyl-L-alanine amidase
MNIISARRALVNMLFLAGLLLTLPISPLSAAPSPAPAPSKSPAPAASHTPSPLPVPSGTASQLDDALKALHLSKITLRFNVGGKSLDVPAVIQEKYHDIYLNIGDAAVVELFGSLGMKLAADAGERTIACASFYDREWDFTIKIDDARFIRNEVLTKLSPPPFIARGEVFIPLKHVPLLTRAVLSLDRESATYFLDPTVLGIQVLPGKKSQILKATASSGFETSSFILKNPRRYVIDLLNVHLSRGLMDVPQKEIFNASTGKIQYSQNSINPGKVRIVIPLPEGLDVRALPQKEKNECLFALSTKSPMPVGVNFSLQKVSPVRLAARGNEMVVQMKMSGPVEYAWHRFKDPDNRFFLDIHNALLEGKKQSIKTENPLIEEVRVAQFQNRPVPIVRIVVDLKDRFFCKLQSSPSAPSQIELAVSKELISMDDTVLDGNGVTAFPRPGRRVICIDPGHGGMDPGAVNYALKLNEKEITLDVGKRLGAILTAAGWNVVLTRTIDRDVSYYGSTDLEELGARVRVANDLKADIMISIHCDASSNTLVRGISTHWYKEIDKSLATSIHERMLGGLDNKDRKVHQNRFYVICYSKMPSVLVETAFITNPQDAANLATPAYRDKIARALAEGVEDYFRTHGKREVPSVEKEPPQKPGINPTAKPSASPAPQSTVKPAAKPAVEPAAKPPRKHGGKKPGSQGHERPSKSHTIKIPKADGATLHKVQVIKPPKVTDPGK